ncbi:MAG TPA: protoporphyrinogen oxidase [Verrucomicrobiota bacterium]|nr:protoporphyrinogen oxidase [Verrucomicrobiota bacterium]
MSAASTQLPVQPRSVGIVGAGITGLTAAFRLKQLGIEVVLYEAERRVGGVIRSIRENGYLAEFGPNSILEISQKIVSLIRDVGLESRRLYSDARAENRYLVRNGRPVVLPFSPLKFFGTELFSARAKLSLLLEPLRRRAAPDVEESVADFVLRRLGREWLDYAINPLVAGIYAGDPHKLSVPQAFPRLHAVEQRYGSLILGQILGARERKRRGEVSKQEAKKISFEEGLQELTDTLGAKLADSTRLGATVVEIQPRSGGWSVKVRSGGTETTFQHSALLLAAPAYRLAQIKLCADAGLSLEPLGAIHYPPVASVVLGFRREDVAHPLDGFGMLIPQVEGFKILGTLFSSSLFARRAPPGHVTLTTYIGGVRDPELALLPADELVRITVADLSRILGVAGKPTFRHCMLYPKAIPQYELGYGRFKALMSDLEGKLPGLFFAGHYRDGISLADSIISGHDVAQRISAAIVLSGSRPPPGASKTP